MSNKKLGLILLGVSLVVIVGFGIWKISQSNNDSVPPIEPSLTKGVVDSAENSGSSREASGTFNDSISVDEVKKHNSEDDCWTIVGDKVFDITSYIPNHPGGDEILRACGEDGTRLFTTRTDENGEAVGSGTPHSPNAESQLEDFLVGKVL